jgi:5'-nucleotidase
MACQKQEIATIDFLARGGDQYPFRGVPFFRLGATYHQALRNYLTGPLGSAITAAQYPEVVRANIRFPCVTFH